MDRKLIFFVVLASVVQSCIGAFTITENNIENDLAKIATVYIKDSDLNETVTLANLYVAQCSLGIATSNARNAFAAFFDEIKSLLIKASILLEGEGTEDFVVSEAAKNRTADELVIANLVTLNVILATQSNASSIVGSAKAVIPSVIPKTVETWYESINLALNGSTNCATRLARIQAFGDIQSSATFSVTKGSFDVIRNGRVFDNELQSQFADVEGKAAISFSNAINQTTAGAKVLARVLCSNEGVTSNELRAIETFAGIAIRAFIDHTEYIITGVLLAAKASN